MLRIFCFVGFLLLPSLTLASVAARTSAIYAAMRSYQYCQENPDKCMNEIVRIGIGGHYVDNAQINTQGYGGHLNLEIIDSSRSNRVQFGIITRFGWDKQTFTSTAPSFAKHDSAFLLEVRPKVGLNLLSQNASLFLNLAYTLDGYATSKNSTSGYSMLAHQVGLELEGILPTQSGFNIEYALGYDYLFAGNYKFGEVSGSSTISNGYTLRASLGFSHKLTENTLYYMRVIGKYHNFSSSKALDSNGVNLFMPATQNYVGMVEFGIGF